jgi:hypothetical protein
MELALVAASTSAAGTKPSARHMQTPSTQGGYMTHSARTWNVQYSTMPEPVITCTCRSIRIQRGNRAVPDEEKGFLLIRSTYKVVCLNCGFRGNANLGKEPIITEEQDGADYCPLCCALALVGADHQPKGKP